MDKILESYLTDIRSLQNYVVGFSLVQSLAFLYSLEKVLPKIYDKIAYILLALIVALITNEVILFLANVEESAVIRKMNGEALMKEGVLALVHKAFVFRGFFVFLIAALTGSIFFFAAKNFTKTQCISIGGCPCHCIAKG